LEALLLPSNLNSPAIMCDQATYNALFQGLVKIDKVDEMWHMFGVMKERGIAPSNLSLHTVISALIVHNRLDDAYTTFLELKASSLYSTRRHTHTHTHSTLLFTESVKSKNVNLVCGDNKTNFLIF
jgi:pentatricopeptide repeat protein